MEQESVSWLEIKSHDGRDDNIHLQPWCLSALSGENQENKIKIKWQ